MQLSGESADIRIVFLQAGAAATATAKLSNAADKGKAAAKAAAANVSNTLFVPDHVPHASRSCCLSDGLHNRLCVFLDLKIMYR